MVAPFIDLLDVSLVLGLILALAPYFGRYVGRVYLNRPVFGDRFLLPVESFFYRLLGVSPRDSMTARQYIVALLGLSAGLLVWSYALLTLQATFPFNPGRIPGMSWDLGLHTATSFLTNTDFVHYTAETQVGLGAALFALQVSMFLSAAIGLSAVAAFIRGFVRKDATLGNFFVDMIRSLSRILVPLSLLAGGALALLGLPQTFQSSVVIHPLGGGVAGVPIGPVASWQSIMLLGSNGGGFFSANSAHPFENPSAYSNLFEIGLMMLIPLSSPFAFAEIIRRRGEGTPYLFTALSVFLAAVALYIFFQSNSAGVLSYTPLATNPALSLAGPYPVGAETRFSLPETAFFQVFSVYGNVGASSVSIGSLSPVAQMVLLFGMFTQSTPGGVGTGFGNLLVFAVIGVFLAGLMVGRTPEYLGKKIGGAQVKWATSVLLTHPFLILFPLGVAVLGDVTRVGGLGSVGLNAHAFTAVLYEFTSESANNGSAFGDRSFVDNTLFFNVVGTVVMLVGRYFPIIAMLMIGSHFARQEP
ncbi:MAG TPA: potassium-transporting ATPase subunit KdpA, partial [Thermoplasmata archaeon]|nr:potassium-transporting ATPase subunit KdpA [Thermoplasmata archaeon]